jgi:hypothetical protein
MHCDHRFHPSMTTGSVSTGGKRFLEGDIEKRLVLHRVVHRHSDLAEGLVDTAAPGIWLPIDAR